MAYTYKEMLFSFKKEGNTAICSNKNEPGGHNQNNPNTEGQILPIPFI
jgi:hypothetical protein